MFALIALICFILALFKVDIGTINLVTLGFVFIALALMFPGWLIGGAPFRRAP
jgi:hypothetical protein